MNIETMLNIAIGRKKQAVDAVRALRPVAVGKMLCTCCIL